jgi:hypothetical protein
MSLRPEISGFDLRKMTAVIGCGDRAIAARAEAHARTMYAGAKDLDAIAGRLNQAILGDIKRGMSEPEDTGLIHPMIALAHFEQTHLETGSDVWSQTLRFGLKGPNRPRRSKA